MSQIKRLQTIDADTLQSTAYEPVSFVVDDLLPQGLHLLAGAPKIGKSWLALWLCLCAAQGKPLWTFATRPCEVLYLCLEDSFQRIQSRLFDLTEDAPPTLHFAVMSQQLHNGLVEQIEQFLKEHPQTRLIVIDTLQRIRTVGNDANPYASDYRDIGVLKALADKHRIAILLIHHLRKMNDDDPMNMISGTTGLSGATDSNFVLRKSQRRENTATLYCTGRDIPYRELALEFDGEDHVWKLLSDDCEQKEQPNERILFLLSELLRRQPEISAPAKALLDKIVIQLFERMKTAPRSQLIQKQREKELQLANSSVANLEKLYAAAERELESYKKEIIKTINGTGSFGADILGEMIEDTRSKLAALAQELEQAKEKAADLKSSAVAVQKEYDKIMSWADLYAGSSIEGKKMILRQLIERVNIGKNFEIEVEFKISVTQFFDFLYPEGDKSVYHRAS